ncbi:MAG: glycosyltransferase family 4 protein [bacterium]|nr:glycosyltransferase family 4 protein [bacterium]
MSARFLYIDDTPTPYRLAVFRRFAERFDGDFRIFFLSPGDPDRPWSLDLDGLHTEVLSGRQWAPPGQRNRYPFKWNPGLRAKIRAFGPGAAAISGYVHPSVRAAAREFRRAGTPYGIACESSFLQSRPSGLKWRIKERLVGPLVRGMAYGLPCGSQAQAYLRALGAERQPMHPFPNTPDVARIRMDAQRLGREGRARFRHELGLDEERVLVLFCGRLAPSKRPADVLEAFAHLSPALRARSSVVLVGDGELKPALRERAAQLGPDAVRFLGWLEPDGVHRAMAACNVAVLPSGHEPWGAVVGESMAAGTPVVASTAVGAAYDLIEHGRNGWQVPVGRVETIAACVARTLEDDDPGRMRDAAQETACRFGADYAANNLLEAVRAAIA